MAINKVRSSAGPLVCILLHPCHELGLVVAQELCRKGCHVIAVERDPALGESFCRRLVLLGGSAALRCVDQALTGCEQGLHDDLKMVYGRLHALITFFAPVTAEYRLQWLAMHRRLAGQLVERAFESRLRLLRALTPLFPTGQGTMTNVLMGLPDDGRWPLRPEAAVGGMLQQMLGAEWAQRKLKFLELNTPLDAFFPGARSATAGQVYAEAKRILNTLSPQLLPT